MSRNHWKTERRGHGWSATDTYTCWQAMRRRCRDPRQKTYKNYGARGIRVCIEWNDSFTGFEKFLEDMGSRPSPAHTIERLDVNGNYCKNNCRWASAAEQSRNKRTSHIITIDGVSLCLADWASKYGLHHTTIRNRLARGWDQKRAVTTPLPTFTKGRPKPSEASCR